MDELDANLKIKRTQYMRFSTLNRAEKFGWSFVILTLTALMATLWLQKDVELILSVVCTLFIVVLLAIVASAIKNM